ncbi:MAG: HAMP domain-containing protein [Xanthomonadales bacterium]|nr:HAMP domain-containing protein [Xanthomonadales bacterium]
MARPGSLMPRLRWLLPAVASVLLLLAALYLAADAEGLGGAQADSYLLVFAIASLAVLGLSVAILLRILGLWRRLRAGEPGARLSRRWLAWLLVLGLPPILLVYGFGVRFIGATVDSWLRANAVEVLQQAARVGQVYLSEREASARRVMDDLLSGLAERPRSEWNAWADRMLVDSGALQVGVFDASGRNLALAAASARWIRADAPAEDMRDLPLSGSANVSLEPVEQGLVQQVRAKRSVGGTVVLAQIVMGMPEAVAEDLIAIEEDIASARRSLFLRDSLKWSFVLILSIVFLLSLLLAVLLAFEISRRMVAPISDLATATRAVAEGRFDVSVPGGGDDELGFLVRGFNRMLDELRDSTRRTRESQQETERQRAFLAAVLGRISSSVIVLDAEGHVRVANPASEAVLGSAPDAWVGRALSALSAQRPSFAPLVADLLQRMRGDGREFRAEVSSGEGDQRRHWLLRGARLADEGMVVVLDDTTDIDRARRDAAWAEVARRLAHEIKNPLTPIQLSAERMRRRLLPTLSAEDADLLDRSTTTIVAQVEALKSMVNAFGEYAQAAPLQLRETDLVELVGDLIDLYAGESRLSVSCQAAADVPTIRVDPGRIRQVLHNLIKNALEAVPEGPVSVQIALSAEPGAGMLVMQVSDDGPGLPPDFDAGWFEPYRTTKTKGTGLGLAVVRKIAEEHAGTVEAGRSAAGGACFTLRLPH